MVEVVSYPYIDEVDTPFGSEPYITGSRIRVRDIVAAHDLNGYTPAEIAGTVYPQLTLAQVYSALAYYQDHSQQIEQFFEKEKAEIENFKKEHPDLVR